MLPFENSHKKDFFIFLKSQAKETPNFLKF